MNILTDVRAHGVEDMQITATDNLYGFIDAIRNVFPQSKIQICVVHQIRNTCSYVALKIKKNLQVTWSKFTMLLPKSLPKLLWKILPYNEKENILMLLKAGEITEKT